MRYINTNVFAPAGVTRTPKAGSPGSNATYRVSRTGRSSIVFSVKARGLLRHVAPLRQSAGRFGLTPG